MSGTLPGGCFKATGILLPVGLPEMKKWWFPILLVMGVGLAGVLWMISRTYSDAPPIPDFVSETGEDVFSGADILRGQTVFQKYGLMDYGSFFGDGAGRGPDFTADALHRVALSMTQFYGRQNLDAVPAYQDAVVLRVQRELKENRHNPASNKVRLTEGQAQAWREYAGFIPTFFRNGGLESMIPPGYISDPRELRDLASVFLWGSWICSSCRPGKAYSYTHNWPYDPAAGNTPSTPVLFWSVLGAFGLLLGVGGVLYIHGRQKAPPPGPADKPPVLLTEQAVASELPSVIQRAAYPFFAVAGLLFFLQICAGILTVHDFLGLTRFLKLDIAALLPITITRSWHLQLAVFWIVTSWIGASIFFMPRVVPNQPRHQLALVRLLAGMLLVTVAGTCVGVVLGTKGLAGESWRTLGHQGWEFVELGRLWQTILFASLGLWAVVLVRGYSPHRTSDVTGGAPSPPGYSLRCASS
jgi:nitric oxide reductase subunit B